MDMSMGMEILIEIAVQYVNTTCLLIFFLHMRNNWILLRLHMLELSSSSSATG